MLKERSHKRSPTLAAATITGDGKTIDCCVRDLSAGGAKLRVADSRAVPQEFQLFLKDAGEVRRAKVRWRRQTEVGVAFVHDRRVFGRRSSPPETSGK